MASDQNHNTKVGKIFCRKTENSCEKQVLKVKYLTFNTLS